MKKIFSIPVVIEQDEDGMYIGTAPSLQSCYTQGATLPELYENLREVIQLSLEVEQGIFKSPFIQNKFIGIQNLDIAIA